MPTNDQIESAFIGNELRIHAEYLSELFIQAIQKKQLIKSEGLLSAFTSSNPSNVREIGSSGVWILEFKFPDHGRLVEIQQKKKKRSFLTEKDARELVWGISSDKKKKKGKNADWYTRNVYGAQNKLIGRLMYGLTDIERERIISALKKEI